MRQSDDTMVRDRADLNIRGNPGWVRWVNGLARKQRTTAAGLVDQLLAERARQIGHESPPLRCGR